jgi:GTP1/Obg family GTP-binding protein
VTDEEIDRESGKRYYMNENTEYDKIFEEGAKWMRDKLPDREQQPENRTMQRDLAVIYETFLRENGIHETHPALDMLHKLYAKLFDRAVQLDREQLREDKYPDTEADGYVFCGKCGKMKEI